MSSRWKISDDTHCMNILHNTADASKKNVFFWLSIILLCWPITAANTNDTHLLAFLGLPRKNHCAINYNNDLFILRGQNTDPSPPMSLSIAFTSNMFNSSSTQMPSIQWMQNDNTNQSSFASICTVTSYGQAIIFYSTLHTNDTIDLNWTSTSTRKKRQKQVSANPPSDLMIVAATITDDDKILIIGRNNTTLSTWLLDASDDQLEWTWSRLPSTQNAAHEPQWMMMNGVSNGFISASMTTTSSYILYFGVDQQSISEMYYNVSVYCFDISSLTWMGSLLNFTSPTNHIQPVMINKQISNSNSGTNDTLLIVPDWIDMAINATTTSDRNVTNADAVHQQQIQQQQHGYWILDIQLPISSSLPSAHLLWHSSNDFVSIDGGSVTLVNGTVVFYGGEYSIRGRESLTNIHSSIDYAANSNSANLRFWDPDNRLFLPTPAWLAPFLPSPSSTPSPSSSPTESTSPTNNDDGYHTVIIILSTFLGLFAIGFIILFALLLRRWNNGQPRDTIPAHDDNQQLDTSMQRRMTFEGMDHSDSAATWAEQLLRSFSVMFRRLGPSQPRKPNTTPSGLIISSPLECADREMGQIEREHQQEDRTMNDGDMNETSRNPHLKQQEHPPPPPLPLSTSSPSIASHSLPQSTRNSWREEGSTKASRFVEHF